MEFGKARGHHVRQVEVADAAVRPLVHKSAVALDPLPVARRHFVGDRRNQGFALLARGIRESQLRLGRCLVHQQRLRRLHGRDTLAIHCHDALADFRFDTHCTERGVRAGIPGVTSNNVCDLKATVAVARRSAPR